MPQLPACLGTLPGGGWGRGRPTSAESAAPAAPMSPCPLPGKDAGGRGRGVRGSLRGPVRRLGIFWKVAPAGAGPPESERKGLPGREGPSRQHRRRRSQRPACAQGRKRLPPEGAESARSQRLPPSLVQSGAAGTGTSQGQERQHPQRAGPGGWPFLRSGLGVTLRSRAGPRLPQPPTRLGEAAPPPQGRPPGGSGGGTTQGLTAPGGTISSRGCQRWLQAAGTKRTSGTGPLSTSAGGRGLDSK